jgi:glycerol uptake facilitator-like aquaporin
MFLINENALLETRMGVPHLNLKAFDATQIDRSCVFLGIGLETLLTFLLVFAIFALFFDPRFRRTTGEAIHRVNYLWLGLFVLAVTLAAGGLTGASMNPARWFGTVIWESTVAGLESRKPWADHGPFWIGPVLGSLLAGMLYTYVLLPADDRKGPPKAGMP